MNTQCASYAYFSLEEILPGPLCESDMVSIRGLLGLRVALAVVRFYEYGTHLTIQTLIHNRHSAISHIAFASSRSHLTHISLGTVQHAARTLS